jgi:choice-of-anchor B domain-containing protein
MSVRSLGWLVRPIVAGVLPWTALALASVAVGLLAQVGPVPPPPEPPLSAHCDCARGVCPLGRDARACSCGCALAADARAVETRAAIGETPCAGGMAGEFPCHDVDLLSLLPMDAIGGGTANDIWGWTDPQSGREYAIVGRTTGTAFVDVSDPGQPRFLGDLPTATVASTWRDIKVFGDHAFIVSEAVDHGLQVFDLTALRHVEDPPVRFDATARYTGFGSAHNLAVNPETGVGYAVGTRTCGGGLHMVDLTEPRAPRTAGCYSLDGYTHDAQCVVYRGPDAEHGSREVCFAANEDTLTVVDVSDKHDARELSRTGYDASAYTHQGWLTEDQRYFLVDDEGDERAFGARTRTFVWDVGDLDRPFLAGAFAGTSPAIDHNLYVRGDLVYEANYRSGLRVLALGDLSVAQLHPVGFFDVFPQDDQAAFNGAWSVYPFFASGTVVVSGIEQGLFAVKPRRAAAQAQPGLRVSAAPISAPGRVGRDLTYVVTVHNAGPEPAAGVQLTLQVPADATLVSARTSPGACTITGMATCDVGLLAAGAEAVGVVVVRPSAPRALAVAVKVVADAMADDPDDNTVTVVTPVAAAARVLALRAPRGGAEWRVGRVATVQWTLDGVEGGVRIELSRDGGTTWEMLAENAPNTGFFDWLVAGPPTASGRVRVGSRSDASLRDVSTDFGIR